MTVPCDTPFLPADLIARFVEVLRKNETEAAVAKVEGHRQPAIAMYRRTVLPKLDVFLDSGQRKVNDWLDTLRLSEVVFDHAREFDNINTQEDLARANQQDVSLRNRIEAEWKDKK